MTQLAMHSQPRTQPHTDSQARIRVFCFPSAGGSATMFRQWSASCAPAIDLHAVQLPGRDSRFREPLCTNITMLVRSLADELQPWLTMPFAFFGHSMGALIAYELARYLRRTTNCMPVHLFVSAFRAPQLADHRRPMHALPDGQFMQELHNLNGTPAEVLRDNELMALLLPRLRADFELCETYTYIPDLPLSCPISVFGATTDPMVQPHALPPWNTHTYNTCSVRTFSGDHFYLTEHYPHILQAIHYDLHQSAAALVHTQATFSGMVR